MARDSLASVDGFRILVQAAFRFLFGMQFCWRCPDCSDGGRPCQDLDGRSCRPEGGICGRAEAAYACIECQKATGSLHAHIQVFIQCLHQHTPLDEILHHLKTEGSEDIEKYLRYKAHVCRQAYCEAIDHLHVYSTRFGHMATAASNPLLDLGKSKIRPPTVSSLKLSILEVRIRESPVRV